MKSKSKVKGRVENKDHLKVEGGSLMTKETGSVEGKGKQPLIPYWVLCDKRVDEMSI